MKKSIVILALCSAAFLMSSCGGGGDLFVDLLVSDGVDMLAFKGHEYGDMFDDSEHTVVGWYSAKSDKIETYELSGVESYDLNAIAVSGNTIGWIQKEGDYDHNTLYAMNTSKGNKPIKIKEGIKIIKEQNWIAISNDHILLGDIDKNISYFAPDWESSKGELLSVSVGSNECSIASIITNDGKFYVGCNNGLILQYDIENLSAGHLEAIRLVDNQEYFISELVATANEICWLNSRNSLKQIICVPKQGGEPFVLQLPATPSSITVLAADDHHVFYSGDNGIYRSTIGTADESDGLIVQRKISSNGFAILKEKLYYVNDDFELKDTSKDKSPINASDDDKPVESKCNSPYNGRYSGHFDYEVRDAKTSATLKTGQLNVTLDLGCWARHDDENNVSLKVEKVTIDDPYFGCTGGCTPFMDASYLSWPLNLPTSKNPTTTSQYLKFTLPNSMMFIAGMAEGAMDINEDGSIIRKADWVEPAQESVAPANWGAGGSGYDDQLYEGQRDIDYVVYRTDWVLMKQ